MNKLIFEKIGGYVFFLSLLGTMFVPLTSDAAIVYSFQDKSSVSQSLSGSNYMMQSGITVPSSWGNPTIKSIVVYPVPGSTLYDSCGNLLGFQVPIIRVNDPNTGGWGFTDANSVTNTGRRGVVTSGGGCRFEFASGVSVSTGDVLYILVNTTDGALYGSASDSELGSAVFFNYNTNSQTADSNVSDYAFALGDTININPPQPGPFYASIKNTSSGTLNLRSGSSTSATVLKVLPEDWIVYVSTTTENYNPITSGGYNWYEVIDPTDNVTGWMAGSDASNTIFYLPFPSDDQTTLASTSSDIFGTSSRPVLIQSVVDHYYSNSSSTYSLYSSDDGPYSISSLKNGGFPEKVILGIAAREDGGSTFGFDNENVSSDFGHGIMQITFSPSEGWDNRGVQSDVSIPVCSLSSNNYYNCYTNATSSVTHYYKHYADNSDNPVYKQYSDTQQSIYSNIKDGIGILSNKYSSYSYINTSTTTDGVTFSAQDRQNILATESYNGSDCGYVGDIANTLDNIGSYFSGATSSDVADLVEKMHVASDDILCVQLHSPAELSIQNSVGKTVGVVNGKGQNDFPMALYDKSQKLVKIFFPDDDYVYKVVGTGNGVYGIDITLKKNHKVISFSKRDFPIHVGEVDTYTVNRKMLLNKQEGIRVTVDNKGNGTVDREMQFGANVSDQK
ncbi:MAG TPA: hypothetical protein VFT82_01385 [Candidatus Paceibacterota bacterium]|nr:hypothetical protein [Candidatus Paceibacterota bacterium]